MADQSAGVAPQEVVRLGSYRVLAELARGGMAAVFLGMREPRQCQTPQELYEIARHQRYDDDALRIAQVVEGALDVAAIKQIHAHLAHDPDFVAMLMDEARIASKIHHRNVVEIRECRLGEDDGTNFIVMEYVAGESLSTLLKAAMTRGGRFSPALAASIGADVAGALHTAHELRGPGGELLDLVHRDVSPQNVIVRYDGCVKLTDFGVAKAVGRLQRTQPGEIKGKLAYMAPEQAYGRAVDRRSDVYSLGVVIYELALGRRLFGGKSDAETIKNIIQHVVPAPHTLDPTFPPGLEEILMGMLQADPTQRFQSAGAVERALRAFVTTAGEPSVDDRLGELARTLDPARYHAKTELIVRELTTAHRRPTPMPSVPPEAPEAHGADTASEARTLVPAMRPARIATQAAPKARTPSPAPPGPVEGSSDRTIPMTDQARAAMASLAPPEPVHPPATESSPDLTQPTLRRSDLGPIGPAQPPAAQSAASAQQFAALFEPPPVADRLDRTMVASDPVAQRSSLRPPDPNSINETMLSELPQQVMQQVAQAALAAQSTPSMPPRPLTPRPTPMQPPEASNKGVWTFIAVGMVLFVVAALFLITRLR